MIRFQKTSKQQRGFTIVELSIATAVFSLVLISALTGFLQIGRMYYKGVSVTNTNETAIQVLNDIQGSIQSASSVSPMSVSSNGNYKYICAGNVRYTYAINAKVDGSNNNEFTQGQGYALVRDTIPGGSACAAPCPTSVVCPSSYVAWNNPVEMLGDKMRLSAFNISPNSSLGPDYFTVQLVVAYGDDEVLNSPDQSSVSCKGSGVQQEYCSVARYDTAFTRGINL